MHICIFFGPKVVVVVDDVAHEVDLAVPDQATIFDCLSAEAKVLAKGYELKFHALHWDTKESKGYFEFDRYPNQSVLKAKGQTFVAPFIDAWKKADATVKALADKEAKDKKKREEDNKVAQEHAKAAEKERQLKRKDQEQYWKNLGYLGSTDYEVIKAMEAKLAEDGSLPQDFVKKRDLARQIVKKERERLNDALD